MQSRFTSSGGEGANATSLIRVLHCIPTLSVGGAETQLKLLSARLAARGVETAVFGRLSDHDTEILKNGGVRCYSLSDRGNHHPAIALDLLRVVRSMRPTIIQTWLTQMDIVGGLVARWTAVPYIVSERSSPPFYSPSIKNQLRQTIGRRAVVVANSPQGLDVWPGHADAQVIGNGIDFSSIAAVPRGEMSDIEPFRGRISIISLSRLIEDKKIDVLISAIGIARLAVPNIRLIVIGDGPDRNRLESLVRTRGLSDYVAFVGLRTDPLEWLRSADIFASASLFEGHPNAVTEAAASGVPSVLSDITMHRTLMGSAALYAPTGDASAFAAHFVTLARDPAARDEISAAGMDAVTRFDIDAITARYIALYQRLTSPRRWER